MKNITKILLITLSLAFLLFGCTGETPDTNTPDNQVQEDPAATEETPKDDDSLVMVIENYPPYNTKDDNGNFTGISVELVKLAMEEAGLDIPLEMVSWQKLVNRVFEEEEPNTFAFSIAHNNERMKKVNYLTDLAPWDVFFYTLKDNNITVDSVEDIKENYVTGTVEKEIGEEYLISKGFEKNKNYEATTLQQQNYEKLVNGRIDFWLTGDGNFKGIMEEKGANPDDFAPAFRAEEISKLFLVATKETDEETVKKITDAIEKVKETDKYQELLEKYGF